MPAGKSSRQWLREHFSDPYVRQARQQGYRSRAAYKLLELQKRDKLFRPGSLVVDLGAAPGGWSQVVAQQVGKSGRVIALDILPMKPIPFVEFIQGDFTVPEVIQQLQASLSNQKADWVISDMAPDMSGVEAVDQARSMELACLALVFAKEVLHEQQGGLLIKAFQGEDFEDLLRAMRATFSSVVIRKPEASRMRSREVYLLGRPARSKTSAFRQKT